MSKIDGDDLPPWLRARADELAVRQMGKSETLNDDELATTPDDTVGEVPGGRRRRGPFFYLGGEDLGGLCAPVFLPERTERFLVHHAGQHHLA